VIAEILMHTVIPSRTSPESSSNQMESIDSISLGSPQNGNDRTFWKNKKITRSWMIKIKSNHNHTWDVNVCDQSPAHPRIHRPGPRMNIMARFPHSGCNGCCRGGLSFMCPWPGDLIHEPALPRIGLTGR
jgi:hypothetical protein